MRIYLLYRSDGGVSVSRIDEKKVTVEGVIKEWEAHHPGVVINSFKEIQESEIPTIR